MNESFINAISALLPENFALLCDSDSIETTSCSHFGVTSEFSSAIVIANSLQKAIAKSTSNTAGVVILGSKPIDAERIRAQRFPHVHRYVVFPTLDNPRLFIPADTPRVASAALNIYSAGRLHTKMIRQLMKVSTRVSPALLPFPQILIATKVPSTVERAAASSISDKQILFAIAPGTVGPASKTTLGVFEPSGRLLAIAKTSAMQRSRCLIANEARMLELLARQRSIAVATPRLLGYLTTASRDVLLQSPVEGRPASTELSQSQERLLAALSFGTEVPATSTSFVRALCEKLERDELMTVPGSIILNIIYRHLNDARVPRTIVHGDFAPWNLREGQPLARAFDWEYGVADGLPLIDRLHHVLQTGRLLRRWRHRELHRALITVMQDSPYPVHQSYAFGLAYLAHITITALEDGHDWSDDKLQLYKSLLDAQLSLCQGAHQ